MSRDEFIRELEYLLQDIQEEEKADALQYYRDYLEEAGPEGEAQAIREYGSPERIAAIIRADISGNLESGGEFTENGYEDERFKDPNYQIEKHYDLPERREAIDEKADRKKNCETDAKRKKAAPRSNAAVKMVLWIVLILAASPFILGIGGTLLGVLAAVAAIILALFCISGVVAVVLLIAGIVIFICGLVLVFADLLNGILCMGSGLVCLGFGMFFLILTVLIFGKMLPWIFRGVIDGINRCLHGRRERNA